MVEDDPILRTSMATILKRAGYEVIAVASASEAQKSIQKEVPCLILLDLLLPKTTGFEFLAKLRKSVKGKKIPVIILTQLHEQSHKDKAKKMGVTKYFIKANSSLHEILESAREVMAIDTHGTSAS